MSFKLSKSPIGEKKKRKLDTENEESSILEESNSEEEVSTKQKRTYLRPSAKMTNGQNLPKTSEFINYMVSFSKFNKILLHKLKPFFY